MKRSLSMRKPRSFTAEFKRQIVEEMLSGTTGPALASEKIQSLIGSCVPLEKTVRGKLNNEPTQEEALLDRINKLEQMRREIDPKDASF